MPFFLLCHCERQRGNPVNRNQTKKSPIRGKVHQLGGWAQDIRAEKWDAYSVYHFKPSHPVDWITGQLSAPPVCPPCVARLQSPTSDA